VQSGRQIKGDSPETVELQGVKNLVEAVKASTGVRDGVTLYAIGGNAQSSHVNILFENCKRATLSFCKSLKGNRNVEYDFNLGRLVGLVGTLRKSLTANFWSRTCRLRVKNCLTLRPITTVFELLASDRPPENHRAISIGL
jgi:hypothetical protein